MCTLVRAAQQLKSYYRYYIYIYTYFFPYILYKRSRFMITHFSSWSARYHNITRTMCAQMFREHAILFVQQPSFKSLVFILFSPVRTARISHYFLMNFMCIVKLTVIVFFFTHIFDMPTSMAADISHPVETVYSSCGDLTCFGVSCQTYSEQ